MSNGWYHLGLQRYRCHWKPVGSELVSTNGNHPSHSLAPASVHPRSKLVSGRVSAKVWADSTDIDRLNVMVAEDLKGSIRLVVTDDSVRSFMQS